jgi:hypothetical protein
MSVVVAATVEKKEKEIEHWKRRCRKLEGQLDTMQGGLQQCRMQIASYIQAQSAPKAAPGSSGYNSNSGS